MDVQIATYGKTLIMETEHMEVARIPDIIASMLASMLGEPYHTDTQTRRWSAAFIVPAYPSAVHVPFELVTCSRGASIRCHWDHVTTIAMILERMVPEIFVEIVPNKLAVPAR